jgi:hypothetical protein
MSGVVNILKEWRSKMRSKYAFDKKRRLYYINFETGKRLSNGRKEYKKITSRTIAGLDEKIRKAAADVTNNTVKSSIIFINISIPVIYRRFSVYEELPI